MNRPSQRLTGKLSGKRSKSHHWIFHLFLPHRLTLIYLPACPSYSIGAATPAVTSRTCLQAWCHYINIKLTSFHPNWLSNPGKAQPSRPRAAHTTFRCLQKTSARGFARKLNFLSAKAQKYLLNPEQISQRRRRFPCDGACGAGGVQLLKETGWLQKALRMVERLAGRKQISSENVSFGLSADDTNSLEPPGPTSNCKWREGRKDTTKSTSRERWLERK